VQADPHAYLPSGRPGVVDVGPLHLRGGRYRVAGAHKREEERVSLRVDLDAVVRCERVSHEPSMGGEDVAVAVGQPFEKDRRSLDVRESERDGAVG
jgi:hypothetical protein